MPNNPTEEPSNVLPFPPVKKGRIRRSRSMDAAGDLSLVLLDRDRKPIPSNVTRLLHPAWPAKSLPEWTPALLLAALVYEQMNRRKKASIRQVVRQLAFEGNGSAGQLLNLLRLTSAPSKKHH